MPEWYPEAELERHGIPPDDFNEPAVYALSLAVPEDFDALREAWYSVYDVEPPEPLVKAVDAGRGLAYVGKAGSLLDRLHDHVSRDVRVVKLLRVCPPVELAAVWIDDDPDTNETQYAYAFSHAHPATVVVCNGDYF